MAAAGANAGAVLGRLAVLVVLRLAMVLHRGDSQGQLRNSVAGSSAGATKATNARGGAGRRGPNRRGQDDQSLDQHNLHDAVRLVFADPSNVFLPGATHFIGALRSCLGKEPADPCHRVARPADG